MCVYQAVVQRFSLINQVKHYINFRTPVLCGWVLTDLFVWLSHTLNHREKGTALWQHCARGMAWKWNVVTWAVLIWLLPSFVCQTFRSIMSIRQGNWVMWVYHNASHTIAQSSPEKGGRNHSQSWVIYGIVLPNHVRSKIWPVVFPSVVTCTWLTGHAFLISKIRFRNSAILVSLSYKIYRHLVGGFNPSDKY